MGTRWVVIFILFMGAELANADSCPTGYPYLCSDDYCYNVAL